MTNFDQQFVAVVLNPTRQSDRSEGDWSSFVSPSREKVIAKAVAARAKWSRETGRGYCIFVGKLTDMVQLPQSKYNLVPLHPTVSKFEPSIPHSFSW